MFEDRSPRTHAINLILNFRCVSITRRNLFSGIPQFTYHPVYNTQKKIIGSYEATVLSTTYLYLKGISAKVKREKLDVLVMNTIGRRLASDCIILCNIYIMSVCERRTCTCPYMATNLKYYALQLQIHRVLIYEL